MKANTWNLSYGNAILDANLEPLPRNGTIPGTEGSCRQQDHPG